MGVLKRIFRVTEWFGSKLPLQIAIFLILAFGSGYDARSIMPRFLLFISYAITYFCLGYLANDLSDIEDDKRAGKRNAFQNTSVSFGIAAFIVTTVLHFAIVLLINLSWQFILMSVIGYLFGIFYSFRPFRFKERGTLGLVVASFCQRNLQIMIIPFMFNVDWIFFVMVNIACFVYGIRFILIHQYMDYENDKISGTKTFVGSAKKITKTIILVCVSLELVLSFIPFLNALHKISTVLTVFLIAGYLIEVFMWVLMLLNKQKNLFTSYFYVPMNFVYLLLLPVLSVYIILSANFAEFHWIFLYIASIALAFCRTIKFCGGYMLLPLKKKMFISCCKKIGKKTIMVGETKFINIEPQKKDDTLDEKFTSNYVIASPVKVALDIEELLPFLTKHECVEIKYTQRPINNASIDNAKKAFQSNNDDMHEYFSIYVFNKHDIGKNQRSTVAKTIIESILDCRDIVGTHYELKSLEILSEKNIEREHASFCGAMCADLYSRKKECFMRVFPVSLLSILMLSLSGVCGYFFNWSIMQFSALSLSAYLIVLGMVCMLSIIQKKVNPYLLFKYKWNYYSTVSRGEKIPFYMVYGIYTESIVRCATYERIKICGLIISVLASMIVIMLV